MAEFIPTLSPVVVPPPNAAPALLPSSLPPNFGVPSLAPFNVPVAPAIAGAPNTFLPAFSNPSTPPYLADGFAPSDLAFVPPGALADAIVEPWDGNICPLGYICQDTRRVNCTIIQAISLNVFQFGDIHAGLYCPSGDQRYTNCPAGSYCPNPETRITCPEGFYCPGKTESPVIRCHSCPEGSTTLARENYGYSVIIVCVGLTFIYIAFILLRRYNKKLYDKFVDLRSRVETNINYSKRVRERRKQLEKIQPKIEILAQRLDSITDYHLDKTMISDGNIRFRASMVFDTMDLNGDGSLSYGELNKILELQPLQLKEFVRRMNELANVPEDETTVSRRTFSKHFLDVLEECSYFQPTPDEAGQLFDEIAANSRRPGFAEPKDFYTSSLANFLSDIQINNLITMLRRVKTGAASISAKSARQRFAESNRSVRSFSGRTGDRMISRETFIVNYPRILNEVVVHPNPLPMLSERVEENPAELLNGVDIAFQDLCLTVKVGSNTINVVDNVTGRVQERTMTALMGGSGAGKTSLLNALCGRAFYGEVTGKVKINGHETSIEEHGSTVGFVPQDDIVYAELTVRENFIYSGRFLLPKGTPIDEIEDLADATLASLGLSRVADSIVGDVNRRGVSGGEKKRVNIGLELMARPSVIFLDEPTSGLDASSALLVMKSLKSLVKTQGVTICSVIHQPRKFIYDLFDSLILLGAGGRMVYHGPTGGAEPYFNSIGYLLPPGESVADWLIDISTGRLEPERSSLKGMDDEELLVALKPKAEEGGPSGLRFENAAEEAKVRREKLYAKWKDHFKSLDEHEMEIYNAPEPFPLPLSRDTPSFLTQLASQLERNFLVLKRNGFSLLVDTLLIVGAVLLISAFEGLVLVVRGSTATVSFDGLISEDPARLVAEFPSIFDFALRASSFIQEYALKIGVITAVLVGLTAAKIITEKRVEFFREAASGYSVNAYFLGVNITATLVHTVQILVCALFAFWLRDSIALWPSYFVHFFLLAWLCVSWALLLPLVVPPNNVVLATGFFMAFFGLLFSGGLKPVTYEDIYGSNQVLAIFSGFVSPTRYFIEGLAVAEHRCLPQQTGFTVNRTLAVNIPLQYTSFSFLHLGQNDSDITDQDCSGFYWGVLPAMMVGLTVRCLAAGVVHVSGRPKQAKKPLLTIIRKAKGGAKIKLIVEIVIYFLVLFVLFGLSCWFILRKV